jgi:hypothetical protein
LVTIHGSSALVSATVPKKFVSMMRRSASRGVSIALARWEMPPLWTITSR